MYKKIAFLFLVISLALSFKTKAQVNVQDSLALVDLYKNTDGAHWTFHDNWLTTSPVSSWVGVEVTGEGRVSTINFIFNAAGTLPSSLGNLTALENLDLDGNKISGSIPASLGNLVNLKMLDLSGNQLSDTIPSSLGNLKKLGHLMLFDNQLSGSIPSSFGNLFSLQYLDLSGNKLSGSIPPSLGNLTNLVSLYLYKNQLTGGIPASLGNPSSILRDLELSRNLLSDSIPSSLGKLNSLAGLILFNNQFSGTIPSSLVNLPRIQDLEFNNNQLRGSIPSSFNNLPSSVILRLEGNQFIFDGMEIIGLKYDTLPSVTYAPQSNILIHQSNNKLSVYAGGTLANDTFRLYKNGTLNKTVVGDSVFTITDGDKYNITVKNKLARQLTLYSDTINASTMRLNLISFEAIDSSKQYYHATMADNR